jgi:hypothetical protein
MKKFILSSIIFLFLLLLSQNIKPLFLIWTDKYKSTIAGSEIYHSIFKSKQKKKTKKIILGDSVANQLFSNTTNNDTINSLTCNQAIGIIGHFFLLNNYLKSENQVDTVFMVFTPFSFLNNLNQVYTYHYFLKPFYKNEYKSLITKLANDQIHKIPYYFICRYPYILTSNWAPDFISNDKINYTFLSPISIEYLTKIKELSLKYNFKIIILSAPIPISKKPAVERIDKNEIVKNNLGSEFKNYFNSIIYLNDSLFIDGLHLKKENIDFYTDLYKNEVLK